MYIYVHNAGGGCGCERVCRQRNALQLCLAVARATEVLALAASFAEFASRLGRICSVAEEPAAVPEPGSAPGCHHLCAAW